MVAEPARDLAEDLSVALLLALERLSPLERAAFLLHDVFDMDYAAIGEVIDRTEAACRQLVARAREHVRDRRPRYQADDDEARRVADAFLVAAASGDAAGLARVLAEDAVMYSDGGGKRRSALNPIVGRDKIMRFYVGIRGKGGGFSAQRATASTLNGLPGFVLHTDEGAETLAVEIVEGRVVAIYRVRNPEKLSRFG